MCVGTASIFNSSTPATQPSLFSAQLRQKTPYIAEAFLLLPLEFLDPAGEHLGERLSLAEILSDQTIPHLASAHLINPGKSVADFPSGKMGNVDFFYRVEFAGSPPYLPSTIRRISSTGPLYLDF